MFKFLVILNILFFTGCSGASITQEKYGEDKNKNGIWDDVDDYIKKNARLKDEKIAMEDIAIHGRLLIINHQDQEKVWKLQERIGKSQSCLSKILIEDEKNRKEKFWRITNKFFKQLYDGENRFRAMLVADKLTSGMASTIKVTKKESCAHLKLR